MNTAQMEPSASGIGPGTVDSEIPSCQGCRRRKLRCSRDKPTCNHCRRLDSPCVYDLKKSKPGIKPGVIESLNRRVESLETTVYGASRSDNQEAPAGPPPEPQQIVGAFSSLIQELRDLVSSSRAPLPLQGFGSLPGPVNQGTPTPAQVPLASPIERRDHLDDHHEFNLGHGQPRKRRRVDSCGNPNIELASQLGELGSTSTTLPPPDLLEDIISAYFTLIQPWIPILHETRFRSRFYSQEQLPRLTVLLHAIVVAAIRFVDSDNSRLTAQDVEFWMTRSRGVVILSAMDGLSVENLQALSIIAFSDMGTGDVARAWPIIGSLTRTVEYLQLSVEADDRQGRPLLKPLPSIPPPQSWTQDEERRRVFWSIFNLDRLCSVMTGWNTSLTSDDVRRRLPADGGLWHKEETVITPYFGIWDRSAARIGNSIVFLPAHYPSPEQTTDAPPETPTTTSSAPKGTATVDMTTVGAFAYCIEATESLSRVTTYFLQQRINFQDRQEVSNWLTRFKELDLRLVHWKMFLPQKWKDSNISRRPTLITMDPNLTLAHVTHNTSMILLHQQIAYPAPQWTSIVRMPSAHSAETCQNAAAETATITRKYLKYTPENSPVNSQFAFCVFVSARALLVHWRYYRTELSSEFWLLVDSLDEMAKRWAGPILKEKDRSSLAGKYSAQLRALQAKCEARPDFSVDVLGYSTDGLSDHTASPPTADANASAGDVQDQSFRQSGQYQDSSIAGPQGVESTANNAQQSMLAGQLNSMIQVSPTYQALEHHSPDELSAISTVLMDQGFMQLDRVISFDDMIFTAQTANDNGSTLAVDSWTLG